MGFLLGIAAFLNQHSEFKWRPGLRGLTKLIWCRSLAALGLFKYSLIFEICWLFGYNRGEQRLNIFCLRIRKGKLVSRKTSAQIGIWGVLALGFVSGYIVSQSSTQPIQPVSAAQAESADSGEKTDDSSFPSPVNPAPDRDAYFPQTEKLGVDEMRIISLGTAMPFQRPAQAAPSFLVELGNGDKFLFDIGTGAAERLAALQIPYNYLNKVFLGHLHADHMGDLPALWVGGTINNRTIPLEIWGPSGSEDQYGTKHAIEGLQQFYNWDIATRRGAFVAAGQELIVHEFDYRGENQVVYENNGVTIRSFPAVHAFDGRSEEHTSNSSHSQ